jgi:hypothetical protein
MQPSLDCTAADQRSFALDEIIGKMTGHPVVETGLYFTYAGLYVRL